MTAPTLLHVYPTFDLGGAQRRFAQLANHFGGDYRHLIVSMDGRSGTMGLLGSSVDARLIDVPRRPHDALGSVKTFRSVLKSLHPALLVTSNWGSIEWAMANLDGLVPHLHMEDGFGPDETAGQLRRRVWTRRLVLWRSTVMLPSRTLYRLARSVWRLPEKRLRYVPNGIDCARFTGAPDTSFARAAGIDDARPVIGTVAALRAEKNVGRLIEAFAILRRHHDAQLVIVGDGPERAGLVALADRLGVGGRVLFTGNCATPEKLLPTFTLFALSSDTEQMPLSLLEAMASARPVAATDVGDVRAMLAEENRGLVTALDAEALAGAMKRLLDDPQAARTIGSANRRRAEAEFDQTRMFEAYRALYAPATGQVVARAA